MPNCNIYYILYDKVVEFRLFKSGRHWDSAVEFITVKRTKEERQKTKQG